MWTALVQAGALAAALGDPGAAAVALRVIDCRFDLADTGLGERAWRACRIPGARYAHLDGDLSRRSTDPRDGRHPWPDAATVAALLARMDVAPDTQVVAYDDGSGAVAARLWCLLRLHGHARVAVLDGGWARWRALGLPVEGSPREPLQRRPAVPEMPLPPERLPRGLDAVLDADAVQAHLDSGGLLVDARAAPRFRGEVEPLDRLAGHVPGAVNRPFQQNLADDGRFKAPDVLAREFDVVLDGRDPASLVAMCGSGVTACHHLLAMAHAGVPVGRLYAGSWSGWIGDPARPVARSGGDGTPAG